MPNWEDVFRVLQAEHPGLKIFVAHFDGIAYTFSTSDGPIVLTPPDLRAIGDKHPNEVHIGQGWSDMVKIAISNRSSGKLPN